jgi:phosphatidate cytidylyltransferase
LRASGASSFGSNLLRRVGTAALILPLLWAALFKGPTWLGVSIVAAAALLGLAEFAALLRARGIVPLHVAGFALSAALFAEVAWVGRAGPPAWPLATLLLLATALGRTRDLPSTVPALAGTLLGAAYLGVMGGAMAGLLLLPPADQGAWRLALLLAITWASDIAAFFVGHAFGRHRLAPALSPGKTVEGALGGLLGGIGGAIAWRAWGSPALGLWPAVALGAGVAATGMAGDLFESLLKRWAGVKDSGTLFPGHGGMLDRLDSLLFGAPVVYYFFLLQPR